MFSSVKINSHRISGFENPPVTRTLVAFSSRHYFADFQRFPTVISPINIGLQIFKGLTVTGSLGLLDYNMHMERNLRKEMAADEGEEIELEEYDWEAAKTKAWIRFKEFSIRFYSTSVIRKAYEELAYYALPPRIAQVSYPISPALRPHFLTFSLETHQRYNEKSIPQITQVP